MTYDIWKYYGDKVGAAAKKCGLDATPKAAAASGSASTSEAPKTTAAQSSAPASSAPATQPSASGHPSQSATAPQTSHASGSSQVPSTSAAGSHSSGAATTGVATTAKPTTGTSHTVSTRRNLFDFRIVLTKTLGWQQHHLHPGPGWRCLYPEACHARCWCRRCFRCQHDLNCITFAKLSLPTY